MVKRVPICVCGVVAIGLVAVVIAVGVWLQVVAVITGAVAVIS